MKVMVNDEEVEVDDQTTVAALLERLGFPEKGIAVAVDWTVLPRSQWQTDADRRRAAGSGDGGAGWLNSQARRSPAASSARG